MIRARFKDNKTLMVYGPNGKHQLRARVHYNEIVGRWCVAFGSDGFDGFLTLYRTPDALKDAWESWARDNYTGPGARPKPDLNEGEEYVPF